MTRTASRLRWLWVLLLLVPAGVLAADWWIALPAGKTAEYVGRESCAACHAQQAERWAGSDHDRAMDVATEETVLGNFDNQAFTHQGITSRLFRRGDDYLINTEGPTGDLEDFLVKYTFGVRPLQQYLVEFDDGRVQALSVAWDTERKRWFHLYPDEKIPPDDVLHWTNAGQNWNYMCAECHSTKLEKNFDLETDRYHTTFFEIDVSCEACHGPGSLHEEIVGTPSLLWDRRYGTGLAPLKSSDADVEIETCAKCHSRRHVVAAGFQPGDRFLDHYLPSLLDGDLYYPDGQIREEVYVYGSFLQSRMYREGVRCTDCHDPHTAGLVAEGNDLCARCHTPSRYDARSHHHHKPGTKAASCVECHMPERTYMVVDPRRDHSIRVPRPDLSVELGTPNACNGCHDDKTPGWASDQVVEWYGPKRPDDPHFGRAIAAGRAGKPEGEAMLRELAFRKDAGPLVRASAVALLERYQSDDVIASFKAALADPEALVRSTAVRSLSTTVSDDGQDRLLALLDDPVRAVRTEAVRVLASSDRRELAPPERDSFARALEEYIDGQLANNDQAGSHLNLAVVYADLGKPERAETSYKTALKLDPDFVPARFNLAMLYNDGGRKDEAEKMLREVIAIVPDMAEAHYSLGLLLAEDEDRMDEALETLGQAAKLAPDHARLQYNYALALQRQDRLKEAEAVLLAACRLAPEAHDILYATAFFYASRENWAETRRWAERLLSVAPNHPQGTALWLQARQAEAGE